MEQRTVTLGLDRLFTRERQQQLYLPDGTWMFVRYLNGLQFLGFLCAFFGLVDCFLGILDVIVVPAFYSNRTNQFPFQLTLANAFGMPIFSGLLTVASGALALRTVISQRFTSLRKFYFSLWAILIMEIVYWCCFIAAIVEGLLSKNTTSDKNTTISLLVIRVFTAVDFAVTLMPCLTGLALYSTSVLGWCCGCVCCPIHPSPDTITTANLDECEHLLTSQSTLNGRMERQRWRLRDVNVDDEEEEDDEITSCDT
ncbi:hypothetical protein FGIG_02193 [Fasciola gigantica]|uniref:Uncharacterized protein n=1 Tax=Fasciola gigantica TaxID=46835 RepID=A0A504YTX2_FASGI|nr:hypothetical protein FGIG_02193 [Fasciola gigantica]